MSYAEMLVDSRRDVVVGESVELLCNTSLTPDIMWTYDTFNDGYVEYVYWNGSIARDKPRLEVKKRTADGSHSLVIFAAEVNDSGLYYCYKGNGMREAGYQLIIAGMNLYVLNCYWERYLCKYVQTNENICEDYWQFITLIVYFCYY